MPPKQKKPEGETFTFDEVAVLCAALDANGVPLGNKIYQAMASADGKRTSSSFEHKFRAVKKRGKELSKTLKQGTKRKAASAALSDKNDEEEEPVAPRKEAKEADVEKKTQELISLPPPSPLAIDPALEDDQEGVDMFFAAAF